MNHTDSFIPDESNLSEYKFAEGECSRQNPTKYDVEMVKSQAGQ